MSVPTKGEAFALLIDHLRYAQEQAAILGHLAHSDQDSRLGDAWLTVSDLMKTVQIQVIEMAKKGMQ